MDTGPLASELLVDDFLLPCQMIVHGSFGAPRSPERTLIERIIIDAAEDLREHRSATTTEGRRLYREAHNWVSFASSEPFGFGWACAIVGLDPQATAAKLLSGATLPLYAKVNPRAQIVVAKPRYRHYVERLERLRMRANG